MITNPNGANQYVDDPRKKLCWDYYIDPNSETFSNAYQSAQRAGYEEGTASQITTFNWFKEKLRRNNLLNKAERNLETVLDLPIEDEKLGDRVLKATLFVSERLGKDIYSTRSELTGKEGKDLMPKPILAYVSNNNSDQEDNADEKENKSSMRRDVSEQDNLNTPILDTPISE